MTDRGAAIVGLLLALPIGAFVVANLVRLIARGYGGKVFAAGTALAFVGAIGNLSGRARDALGYTSALADIRFWDALIAAGVMLLAAHLVRELR